MKTPGGGMNRAPKAAVDPQDLDKYRTITGTLKTSGEKVRMIRGPIANPVTGRMEVEIDPPEGTTGTVTVPWDLFVPDVIPDMDDVDVGERPEGETAAPTPPPAKLSAPSAAAPAAPAIITTPGIDGSSPADHFKKGLYDLAAKGDRGIDRLGAYLSRDKASSPDTEPDLTPAERAKQERVKLSSMIGTFKELMKKPELETVEMTPQEEIRWRREVRAMEFAKRLGLLEKREEVKLAGARLYEEYKKFYGGTLAGAREKLGKKPNSLEEAEEAFAKESEKYGKEVLDYASGVGDIERKRAIAFNLRDTVYGKEEMRIAAREAAQTEKQKKWYNKTLGWAGKAAIGAAKAYKSGTDTLGRAAAAGLALERGETAETLDKAAFENDARFYANAGRLLGASALGAALFSATPLAALGFGGNLAWRLARGTVGMVAGQRFALMAQKAWKESDEENRINELKDFRKKSSFTAEEVRAFQDAYASGNVEARRGRRVVVTTMAAIAGGVGTTGLFAGAESITANMDKIPAIAESVDAKLTAAAAPVMERVRDMLTTDLEKSEDNTTLTAAPAAPEAPAPVTVPVEPPVQAPQLETPAEPVVESPEAAETVESKPEAPADEKPEPSPAAPAESTEAPAPSPEAAPGKIEAAAKPGDGYDRMFASLQDQLRAQYASVARADVPPTVQHILAAGHENMLSREFGLAWGEATDNSGSAPVEIGDKLVIDDGKLVLVRADGAVQEFMNEKGEQVYTYEAGAPTTPTPEASAPAPEESAQVETSESVPAKPEAPIAAPVDAVPQQPIAAEAAPISRPMTIADTLGTNTIPQAPTPEAAVVGERPLTIAEIVEGLDELSTAAEITPNEHGVVVDPSRQSLYEWDVPGTTTNSLFAAGRVTELYLAEMANKNPGVPVLYEHTETNALGVETKEVRAVMKNVTTGAIEFLPREVTNRIPLPNPNDFVRLAFRY